MKVVVIRPQGYCKGVINALDILDDIIKDEYVRRPIYMLGNIIHNKAVMQKYIDKDIIILEDKTKTRLELLDMIDSGSVIFSAHGVSPQVREKALKKELNIIDTTCSNVLLIQEALMEKLKENYTCIYIGKKNHPECEGALGISKEILFVETKEDALKLNITNPKVYVTNQTTLSHYDIEDIFDSIKEKYPHAIIANKICLATTIRQNALTKQQNIDLCLIVGDVTSSNSKRLVEISISKSHTKTLLVESLEDVKKLDLKNINTISISSGASTPKEITNEIIEYLRTL